MDFWFSNLGLGTAPGSSIMYYQLGEMSRNSDYTTANLLDLLYCQKYYKLMDIDLSRQTKMTIPRQINFKSIKYYSKDFFRFINHDRII